HRVARVQFGPRMRARRRGSFARPYPALLISLTLVMWPSTGPVLHGYRKALVIASRSSVIPAARRAKGFNWLAAASINHCLNAVTSRSCSGTWRWRTYSWLGGVARFNRRRTVFGDRLILRPIAWMDQP